MMGTNFLVGRVAIRQGVMVLNNNNFVCWAVRLTVSKPLPKAVLNAVSKFLLGKTGRLPVR